MEGQDRSLKRSALRADAVQAVISGEKKSQVAQRCGVTRQTLHAWCARHRAGGMAALAPRPLGRTPRRVLEPWQEAQVAGAIMLLPPWTVDTRYTRWTKKAISSLVERKFGVRLSQWMVDSHLRRWGFTSSKQVRLAYRRGPFRAGAAGVPITARQEAAAGR